MRRLIQYFIGIALLAIPSFAYTKDLLWDEEMLSNATILLYQQISRSEAKSGSGTIIIKGNRYYILTASHVSNDMKNDAKIIFRLNGDKPGIYDLLPITKGKSLTWKIHPVADAAIIELETQDQSIKNMLNAYAFPAELIYGGKELPIRGADLTFLGYPVVDMEMEHFSPLMFTAYLSSGLITQPRADTKSKCNFFYLSIPSIQGCSGSGLYFSVKKQVMYYGGNKTIMIGIVHGTQSDNTGGKLAAITPAYYVAELFKD